MSAGIEIRPTTYAEWYALEEERDKLRAELDRLRSAPVAVEVPTWSADAFCAHVGLEGAFSAGDIRVFFAGAKACHGWISKEIHPTPSDRVLNDGEVAISLVDLRAAISAILCSDPFVSCGVDHTQKCQSALDTLLKIEVAALLSQRAAEGGAG